MAAHLLMAAAAGEHRALRAETEALARFVYNSTASNAPRKSVSPMPPLVQPPSLAVRAVLRQARARIADGWCQNADSMVQPGGAVAHCAVGAVRAAAVWGKPGTFDSRLEPAVEAAASILLEATGEADLYRNIGSLHGDEFNTQWLSRWNDDGERTHAEVITVFDRALEALRAAERLGGGARGLSHPLRILISSGKASG